VGFKADKIWFDGKFVPWEDAKIHVLSHVVHYGTSAFEGIRCYRTKKGSAVHRLQDHVKRLFDTCKIYRMDPPYAQADICAVIVETLRENRLEQAYVRPVVFRGYGQLGVNPLSCPLHVVVAAWDWGKYLGAEAVEKGVSVKISTWARPAPNTLPTMAKVGANYMNSQLIKLEAVQEGYDEGIALDVNGFVSEGSGENVFVVRGGKLYTPPSSSSILPGITRHCVFQIARDMGIEVLQHLVMREALYIADEVFMTGTAAEITPVTKVDMIAVADGKRGPITKRLQDRFFGIVSGEEKDVFGWLTYV
jgi:branched-chain amino acid aminotransferase